MGWVVDYSIANILFNLLFVKSLAFLVNKTMAGNIKY
jgi:hypothetical protein